MVFKRQTVDEEAETAAKKARVNNVTESIDANLNADANLTDTKADKSEQTVKITESNAKDLNAAGNSKSGETEQPDASKLAGVKEKELKIDELEKIDKPTVSKTAEDDNIPDKVVEVDQQQANNSRNDIRGDKMVEKPVDYDSDFDTDDHPVNILGLEDLEDFKGECEQLSIEGYIVGIHNIRYVKTLNRNVQKLLIACKDHRIQLSVWGKKIDALTSERPELCRKIRVTNVELKMVNKAGNGNDYNEGSSDRELRSKATTQFTIYDDGLVSVVGELNCYDNSKKITVEIRQGREHVIQVNFWNDQTVLTKNLAQGDKIKIYNVVCNSFNKMLSLNTNPYTQIEKL